MFSRATASGFGGNSCDDLSDRFSSHLLSRGKPMTPNPRPNGAVQFQHPTPHEQRPQEFDGGLPCVVAPRKPRKAHQLRFGHVKKALEQREFYQLTADDEKCGSEMVLMSEQDEAEWLDRFEYEPRHDQEEQCRISVQCVDPSTQSPDPPQRHQTPSQRTHN